MKRNTLANVIATIIAVLALLLGIAGWALWVEWGHHKRAHPPSEPGAFPETSSLSQTPGPSRERPDQTAPFV